MKILKADIEDNEILTSITKKSKAHWGFSQAVLEKWEHLLTVTKDYIEKNKVYKLVKNKEVIGYYSYLLTHKNTVKLDNLFILPEYIGTGCGKILMKDFLKRTEQMHIDKITLDAEPNAENFYRIFGFETIGQLESSIKDRYLPIMELQVRRKQRLKG